MNVTIVFQKNWDALHKVCETCKGIDSKHCDFCTGSGKHYKYIINKGSSRSSKTYSLIDVFDLYAREVEKSRLTIWRDTKTDCKKTVLSDMIKRLKSTDRYKVNNDFNKTESIFTYQTDSTVEIHGTDDEETVHGLTQNCAWLNEPYKIGRDTFDQIDMRSDVIFLDYNPKKDHWADDLMKNKRTIVIHSTFKDNPFCPPEQRNKILSYQPISMSSLVISKQLDEIQASKYDCVINDLSFTNSEIKELQRCQTNEHNNSSSRFKWEVYGLGLKSEKPNRIFNWNEVSLNDYNNINTPTYIGVDWGKVDPWGIIEAKYYDGCLYVHELNYASENEHRARMNNNDISIINSEGLDDNSREAGIVTWLFSKLNISKERPIICDTNRPVKIAGLRRKGYNAEPATKGAGSILDGIDLLQNLKVFYTKISENIHYEQENYSYKLDRYGKVLDEANDTDNHLIDPIRYVVNYLLIKGIIKNL